LDSEQATRPLDEIRRALEAAENAGDPEVMAGLFAEDAVLMVPDFPVHEGKAACSAFIRDLLPGLLTAFDRRVVYTSAEVRLVGDVALDRGTFFFTARPREGGAIDRVTGKYLWLYERDSARAWKCARMIMSRDEGEEQRDRRPVTYPALTAVIAVLFAATAIGFVSSVLRRPASRASR